MAITRAQQAKQMLQNGGMLVQPGFGGTRQGYRGPGEYQSRESDKKSTKASAPPSMGFGNPPSDDRPSKDDDAGMPTQPFVIPPKKPKTPKLKDDKKESIIDKINRKTKERNKRFINKKFAKLKTGIMSEYGLTQEQIEQLIEEYDRDLNKFDLTRFREIVDAGAPPRIISSDPNFLKAQELALSKGMAKGKNLSTAALFSTPDPTSRIELPSPLLNKLQGPETFSNLSSGLNRLQTLEKLANLPGGVPQSEIDNYFNLTMGKGGVDPVTGKEVPALFPDRDDPSPQITDPCKGPNPPAYCFIGEKAEETIEAQRNLGGLPARITGSLFDFTGMADGGRIGAMGGGMMDLDSARQMMFLGGIAKSISKGLKGVTRAAKKVFKSPVGKAALLGLGAYYAPGIGIKATGGFPEFTKPGGFLSTLLTKGGDKALNLDNLSGLKIAGLLTAAPFLFSSDEEEEDKPTDMGPTLTMEELLAIRANPFKYLTPRIAGSQFAAEGGRIGYQKGSKEPVAKKVMPLLDMGGKEMDLRDNGGFVPIGRMEKADDVPARLSKNEFVFTADAVRNAGDGDVDKGAEVMYNMMKNLERGGNVSEESQGLEGAREMFQTAQRLGEVV
jgi:hypothetical protein